MRLEPTNLKGHFRKGLSLHAMKRYGEAVLALVEAEKLDGKHEQVLAEEAGLDSMHRSICEGITDTRTTCVCRTAAAVELERAPQSSR